MGLFDKAIGFFRQSKVKARQDLTGAVMAGGKFLLQEAQKLTPVDTGFLRSSGEVRMEGVGTDKPIAKVVFTAPYAIYVHENLTANHPNGGQAKFLEEPARTKRAEIQAVIAAELERRRKL